MSHSKAINEPPVVRPASPLPPLVVVRPCQACGAPRQGTSRFCASCGSPLETAEGPRSADKKVNRSAPDPVEADALPDRSFECKNCGSHVATSTSMRSYVCPFCDSAYVTEIPLEQSGRQRPEFVIGFNITPEQAAERFYRWIGKSNWFRPGDLARRVVTEKKHGIYLPFWHFSMAAESRWSAKIGEYWYRTETYTVKDSKGNRVRKTRRVRETEWFPLRGRYRRYYFGHLVAGTKSISEKEAQSIQPFQLSALDRYRPYFLAGWMAEEYSIPRETALKHCKAEFRNQQARLIQRFLPGDTHSQLQIDTQLDVNGSDLVLLPVYVLSYRYRDHLYRFLVNGQTGAVIGEKPWSSWRIAVVVLVVLTMIAATALAIAFASS